MIEDKSKPLYGIFRAEVVDNKDPEKYGRVMIWIPDLMPKVDRKKGIWAFPANNPIGGRNPDKTDSSFFGTSYIPPIGSLLLIFFEGGNINRPFYISSLDIKTSKVLPECQVGDNYQDKWVIFKSGEGRCIVVSDDESDCRVEITGKKRNITSPPAGDTASVYTIDGNQTTILLDEREGKEKILIRTYKGDFLNIDVSNRKLDISFDSDIQIKTGGKLTIMAFDNIDIKGLSDINIQSGLDMNIKSGADTKIDSTLSSNLKGNVNTNIQAGGIINNRAGGAILSDGASIADMSGASGVATPADAATDAEPSGNRD